MEEIKCAVYTRKSTDEGLEKEFNTLEAQREAGENYVKSQKHQGWVLIKEHYDDGGFSGGNMNRPSLKRLLQDVEAGKVNMIVVYKIDRLTRSLTDFAKMVDIFDKSHFSFSFPSGSYHDPSLKLDQSCRIPGAKIFLWADLHQSSDFCPLGLYYCYSTTISSFCML